MTLTHLVSINVKSNINYGLTFNKPLLFFVFLSIFLVMSGCFALPVEEPVLPPPVIRPFAPAEFDLAIVTRGNLARYRTLSVNIVPVQEEVLSFAVPDIYIHAIHVEVGDEVRAGDIVAELDREGFERSLYLARRNIDAARINISHLDEREPLSYLEAGILGNPIEADVLSDERDGLQTELHIYQIAANHLQAEDDLRVLRTHMNGTVTHTMAFRPGDLSNPDARVVTIADETQQLFSVIGSDSRYLVPGDIHTVYVNREPIQAIVVNPDVRGEAEDDRAFLTAYGDEALYFPDRTFATMQLILEEIENVLIVPSSAIHVVDEREFVFVIENDLRVIRDVVTGMVGNHGIEIISGLTEEEIVVV